MRYVLLLPILLFAGMIYGQITIQSADMPSNGSIYSVAAADSGVITIDPSLTGINYIWDFSSLTYTTSRQDTFTDLQGTQNPIIALSFLGAANLAQKIPFNQAIGGFTLSNGFRMFRNASGAFEEAGFAGTLNGFPFPARYSSNDRLLEFPLTYGDTFSSNITLSVNVPSLLTFYREQYRFSQVDGWGKLYLPTDTLDVLRVVSLVTQDDSIVISAFPFPVAFSNNLIEYKWYAKGKGIPVLQINQNALGGIPITTGIDFQVFPPTPTGIARPSETTVSLSPMPCTAGGHVLLQGLDLSEQIVYQWTDLTGRIIASGSISDAADFIPVPEVPAGQYLLMIRHPQGDRAMQVVVQ